MSFNKEKVMDAARKFVDKGQIDKAVKEYLRIVKEDPKDVRVWLKIGDLYAKQGSKQDASETYLKVARFYEDEGFAQKAVAVYKQILKIDPRLVDVNLKLAELYRTAGLHTEAMQHFEAVAGHFHREGNTKEALATVRRVVELDPENIATRIKLAELYSKENMITEAVTEFAVACDQLRRQNRPDDFLKVAERLLWHKPDAHDLNRELAALYLQRNDARRALQKLQASFKANPRDVETLALLAQAFFALDQKAKTVSVLKELAKVHIENKSRDKAADVYRKILEFVGNDAESLAFLGRGPAPAAMATAAADRIRAGSATPLATSPSQLAAAAAVAGSAKPAFRLTGELPAIGGVRATGAMPLVDERTLAATDFALPDYDDNDDNDGNYSAALNDGSDGRGYSATDAHAEQHADEISKILAECDVYVKYGLHQKAIDHLRRVFVLDESNVEARERLKDILISQGRDTEAQEELLRLAETVVPHDARRAEEYLRELFALNGAHTGAHELARRNRLRVGRLGTDGAVGTQSDDPHHHIRPESEDEFDPADFAAPSAHGSPAPARPPAPPRDEPRDTQGQHLYDLQVGQQTALTGIGEFRSDEFEFDDDVIGASQAQSVSDQLSDAELADDIDREVAAEMGGYNVDDIDEDLPFDLAEARAFDAGVKNVRNGFGKAGRYPVAKTEVSPEFELGHADYSTDYPIEIKTPKAAAIDPFAAELTTSSELSPVTRTIEDDLEEAEFYIHQAMWGDAVTVLQLLHARHPQNRLVASKLEEAESMFAAQGQPKGSMRGVAVIQIDAATVGDSTGADIYTDDLRNPTQGQYGALRTEGIDLNEIDEIDEIEEVDADVLDDDELPNDRAKPGVLLENPVEDNDATTHYDLGQAYREMGLFDDAVKAFEKVLRTKNREVQCRLMIGLCYRDQGNAAEGVTQFKHALHSAGVSELERQSLYYELAVTYESLKDYNEALYYLDMILKKDAGFADAAQRASRLRALL